MEASSLLDRLRAALESAGLHQAVVSHPETLSWLRAFELRVEDWPVANPFATVPALLCLGPDDAVVVVADFYADAAGDGARVTAYRSYDYMRAPDPPAELRRALAAALDEAGLVRGPTGVEARSIPLLVAEWLRELGREPIGCDDVLVDARRVKEPVEIEAIRRASRLADVVQLAIKEHAVPGVSEVELAGRAATAMYAEAGRRVPSILTVSAGPEATATGGGVATDRVVQKGDLVLTDTAPWIGGCWSDTANAVFVGTPDAETRRRFDAVRRALHEGIALCRPGTTAGDVDREVRAMLAEHGPTYPHHTGHGLGAAWSEEPRITPYSDVVIDEGMVLALEPALYIPGWGGIRLEHVFVVRAGGSEILTQFEHTL